MTLYISRIATRFNRKLGRPGMGGDFNPDTAITHGIADDGRTVCGIAIGLDIRSGGKWERGNGSMRDVNCARCLKKTEAE